MRLLLVLLAACATKAPPVIAMISANAEWKALPPPADVHESPYGAWFVRSVAGTDVVFFHGGWGKVAAAGSTQYAIDRWHPQLVVNLGTCGGFAGAAVGDVVLATETVIYDIIEQMGDPDEAIAEYRTKLDVSRWPARLADRVKRGPIVSADRDLVPAELDKLGAKYHASAGDWESGAIAWVASKSKTRVVILRGVTDVVGAGGDVTYGNEAAWERATQGMMAKLVTLATDALPDLVANR
jgi:adenosylhomocysteine nucleosidase